MFDAGTEVDMTKLSSKRDAVLKEIRECKKVNGGVYKWIKVFNWEWNTD